MVTRMIRHLGFVVAVCLAGAVSAQQASDANAGELRILDKVTGSVTDIALRTGESKELGHLKVTLNACRFPTSNPSGDAFAEVTVWYRDTSRPVFAGWLIASAPALNAMEHPRYDVWVMRCITS